MSSVDTQLHAALARALDGVPHHELRRRVDALSHRYRTEQVDDTAPAVRDHLDALAYAVIRMPATFRALYAALSAAERHVDAPFTTHLDLGGGTGAAAWAAESLWPHITTEILERQPAAIHLGQQLATGNRWHWTAADLHHWSKLPDPDRSTPDPCEPAESIRSARSAWSARSARSVDLITIGYVLNELSADTRRLVIHAATRSAKTIVLVEPGTPNGHRRTLDARDLLLDHGFRIAAPCPHEGRCPTDWCNFAARLPRTELHRVLKDGTRNYEEERFSYVVATRAPVRPAPARVIRRPARPKGRVMLELCTSAGTAQQIIVPKSDDAYRAARSTNWGDAWT
ncbi:ribosomal protein RSM22 (predicted rRNA methylase) [Kribbella rubisoli]|uniref:Ribosomal protein RSM22 (Predicted rRNA methylase) n=1 Tax=Kribbella rubisoli TaxID=3075929 RepID=A0A4Q7WLU1_9ACTN|nr:small ribosomal subunit Rsm22 family protein [Kribbella rubisoli]RZU10485.1 ribosomal protein RSM22 (predicted rRNA methylase) [Kribbella rubisoli]